MEQLRKLPWEEGAAEASQRRRGLGDDKDQLAGLDKVIRLALAPKDDAADGPGLDRETLAEALGRSRDGLSPRHWSAALDLVRQASDAIDASEMRAQEVERRIEGLMRRAAQELEAAEMRMAAAEARAKQAEARAEEAEEWLKRLYDAITSGLVPRNAEPRARQKQAAG